MSLSGMASCRHVEILVVVIGLTPHWTPRAFIRRSGRRSSHRWCTHPISVLCRHFWHLITDPRSRIDGQVLVSGFLPPGTYPVLIACLLRCSWVVRAVGGKQWLNRGPRSPTGCGPQLHVNLGWVVQIYNTAERCLISFNPIRMLPLLGLLTFPRDSSSLYRPSTDCQPAPWCDEPVGPARTLPYSPPHFRSLSEPSTFAACEMASRANSDRLPRFEASSDADSVYPTSGVSPGQERPFRQ